MSPGARQPDSSRDALTLNEESKDISTKNAASGIDVDLVLHGRKHPESDHQQGDAIPGRFATAQRSIAAYIHVTCTRWRLATTPYRPTARI